MYWTARCVWWHTRGVDAGTLNDVHVLHRARTSSACHRQHQCTEDGELERGLRPHGRARQWLRPCAWYTTITCRGAMSVVIGDSMLVYGGYTNDSVATAFDMNLIACAGAAIFLPMPISAQVPTALRHALYAWVMSVTAVCGSGTLYPPSAMHPPPLWVHAPCRRVTMTLCGLCFGADAPKMALMTGCAV